ncbi:MAG: type II toxin-antitoxin system prevent-host-death family antitoxin [Acidimicrobiia bacterium]
MEPLRDIPQRELRNHVSRVLREVEAGRSFRVTVDGRPVAELRPVSSRRTFVPRDVIERIIREAPLDANFMRDIEDALDQTID